jgi:uncharacterized protein (DUF924 family)
MNNSALPLEIRNFWFAETISHPDTIAARREFWFAADAARDEEIKARWGNVVDDARAGNLDGLGTSAAGRLALILLLDQFPRNIYRGKAEAFSRDGRARYLMRDGMGQLMDLELSPVERCFFYMPLQHSEFLEDQESAVARYKQIVQEVDTRRRPVFEVFLSYARTHRDVIARFGRFPHRNAILGRLDTPEEASYLAGGGERFGQS